MATKLTAAVGAAAAAGVATVVATVALAGEHGVGPVGVLVALTAALTLSWLFPLLVLRREETEGFQLDEAFLVAMALLLPPLGTVLAFLFAVLVSQLVRRRPATRVLFNTGVVVTATGLALAVARLAGAHGDTTPLQLAAVVAGAFVFLVVNAAAVWAVLAIVQGQSFWNSAADGLGFRLLVWAATVAIGVLGGLAGSAYSWALLLAALPMGVLQVVLAGSLRARADRERLDGLLQAAIVAHASMEPADVEEAITGSARTLLQCREARIGEVPPDEGELGSPLAGHRYPERWLVVSERRGVEPFGAHDAKLLDAIVAVGSSALENASLVDLIKHQVFHDALTGLPNQLRFEERTSAALGQLRSPGDILAVLCIDLDRFKRINDGLGHPAGNELLRQAAARLSAAVQPGDTVARMGGDEFTILLTAVRSTHEAIMVAEKILRCFVEPFVLEGQGVHLTPSIGIAVAPAGGARASALLKNADTATHRAKERGRNCYQLYSAEMNVEASERLALEGDLHEALDRRQLRVVYQPQVDLTTGRTVGVEALARWPHPVLGMIGPDTFIPLAEETGLIAALDDWVLQTACAQGRAWAEAGLPSLRIAVNLSGQAFHRTSIVARVAETLARTGLPASQLELEVTESMAIDQVVDVRPTFRDLESLGVKLAIDDFGTGYSALSRLQGFPFHSLKIDRSFVANIETAHDGAPIVAAMIAMAHALGLDVVAEGVETSAQQAFLEGHRCDMAQGYRFSRPLDPDDIGAFLVRHRGLVPVR